ncbi:hypothetical protein LO772_15590 [Yinghuangia sp. ASG 101]|uniref:hypothetical protein n=1 Tax=Yinghuangia sp. ASG 101 TaxID=2896848 RepID=UPI001E4669C6|nr:hypothetical protein [Yinghuangia sp. ASG 101]UGQ14866.1 hypothetical protein LO772_15590 [Yinghuangia sp. ASG 101]
MSGVNFVQEAARLRVEARRAEQLEAAYHEARVLLLIARFTTARGSLAGLTKLAKLDFLLRYPVMLERLLPNGGRGWPAGAEPTDAERVAVESRMTRYKYGPWDQRYYGVLASLVARGLITVGSPGQAEFRVTERGAAAAASLEAAPQWAVVAARAKLLKKHFNRSGSALKNLIYDKLPDAVDRPWRAEI